jgi:iron complex transport system permease protein
LKPATARLFAFLLLLALGVQLVALLHGSVPLHPADLWRTLGGEDTGLARTLILDLRLPRALSAFATGALLALAGTLMQVLLRNPLADPYVLGISGGAATGALLAVLFGAGALFLHAGAFLGALGAMLLVFGLARGAGRWTATRLLLTGVMVAAGFGALISFVLAVAPDAQLRGMLFWLMGDLSQSGMPLPALAVLTLGLVFSLPLARSLNVLARGELQAAALGVAVAPLRLRIYLLASLLTAAAVTTAGSVGFIGLVVPHMLRLMAGNDHRLLMPGAVLLGGSLLTLADILARSLIAPQQLPTGVITALLGVPFFLYLLARHYRTHT